MIARVNGGRPGPWILVLPCLIVAPACGEGQPGPPAWDATEDGHAASVAPSEALPHSAISQVAPASGRPGRPAAAPPAIDPVESPTWRVAVTLTGVAEPLRPVAARGPLSTGRTVADEEGRFAVGVELQALAVNEIAVTWDDPYGRTSAPARVTVVHAAERVRTRGPLVLHHGYMGFRELVGVEYWWGIVPHLEAAGFDVRTTEVPPFAAVADRAAELAAQVRRITSGKVALFGHSLGGLDARYAVSRLGLAEQVAAVTTVGSPNHGTPVADAMLQGRDRLASEWLLEVFGIPAGAVGDMTVSHVRDVFNVEVPDAPGVAYHSWATVSDPFGLETGAPLNPLLSVPYGIIRAAEGANDGLVSVRSAAWGEHLGTLPADHMDQVGHLLGLTDDFDHLAFWLGEAERMEAAGY